MDATTEATVHRVLELLARVRTFRCRYQDLSFRTDIDARRVVEIRGDASGRFRLRTLVGTPEVEAVITGDELVRMDYTNHTGYRIDFSRHPFSIFHRYGWLRVDHPFSLFDQTDLRFRAVIGGRGPLLLFEALLSPSLFTAGSAPKRLPTAQFALDGKTGLLRELLILSNAGPERFVFTNYAVNKRLGRRQFELVPDKELGDMTELYWNQIRLAQGGIAAAAPFFNWN